MRPSGGIDDQRRPPRRLAPVEPERIVGPRVAGRRRLVAPRQRVLVEGGDLLGGQPVPSRVPSGPLQRRDGRERPDALEIRVAPRRARHRPAVGRGLLRLPRGPRREQPRRRDHQTQPHETPARHLAPPDVHERPRAAENRTSSTSRSSWPRSGRRSAGLAYAPILDECRANRGEQPQSRHDRLACQGGPCAAMPGEVVAREALALRRRWRPGPAAGADRRAG